MAANPMARKAALTSTPGWVSATRAGPIGINGDARTATATARSAPEPAISPTRRRAMVTS